jgi:plasmid stabilization system protein ParE
LKISWTQFAENQLLTIFEHSKKNAIAINHNDLIENVLDRTIDLIKNPYLGPEEELLKHRSEGFRYLVHGNFKIIYWVDENNGEIFIANVFDCRQDPAKIQRTK